MAEPNPNTIHVTDFTHNVFVSQIGMMTQLLEKVL